MKEERDETTLPDETVRTKETCLDSEGFSGSQSKSLTKDRRKTCGKNGISDGVDRVFGPSQRECLLVHIQNRPTRTDVTISWLSDTSGIQQEFGINRKRCGLAIGDLKRPRLDEATSHRHLKDTWNMGVPEQAQSLRHRSENLCGFRG